MLKTLPYLAINAERATELEDISTEEIELNRIRDEDIIKWIEEIKRTKIRDRTELAFNDFLSRCRPNRDGSKGSRFNCRRPGATFYGSARKKRGQALYT